MQAGSLRQALTEIEKEKSDIEAALSKKRAELADLRHRREELEEAAVALRTVLGIESHEEAEEEEDETRIPEKPAGVDFLPTARAVELVLRENSDMMLTARGILDAAEEANLLNPDLKQPYGAVLEAAKRLAENPTSGVSRIDDDGVYFTYDEPSYSEFGITSLLSDPPYVEW